MGYFIDRLLLRRTGENHLAQVLLTVGIAFVLGDVALKIWGGDSLKVPVPMFLRGPVTLPGELVYPAYRIALMVLGVVIGVLLWLLYTKTQLGAIIRAGVDDREQVSATGINVNRSVHHRLGAGLLSGRAWRVWRAAPFLTLYTRARSGRSWFTRWWW